jgi:uncharacterized membrane protein YcgQ (UPF0703/DUF1980 family)
MNIKDKLLKIKEELKSKTDIKFSIKGAVKLVLRVILFFIVVSFFILSSEYNTTVDDYNKLVDEYNALSKENEELKSKLDEAEPWFKMKEEEQKAIEEENAKKEAEEEAKRKAEEEEAERLAEEEEKKGYDTGIGYKDLARNPENYVGKKIKFEGKVIQVMEGDGEVQIRLAVNGDYDNIMYCAYDSSIVTSRVLEDDYITVMGVSTDLLTYTSTMGGEITIPSMLVEKIDM